MTGKINILAISGSTRQSSSNLNLIKGIAALAADAWEVSILQGLLDIPHFNPDLVDNVPEQVMAFQQQLHSADGILICTPEYAAGVPGTLKNAIDWTVASMALSQKPVALVTAGTSGYLAHQSLLGTLLIIEAKITDDMQLVVPMVKTKVDGLGQITDPATLAAVKGLIVALTEVINGACLQPFLTAPLLRLN